MRVIDVKLSNVEEEATLMLTDQSNYFIFIVSSIKNKVQKH